MSDSVTDYDVRKLLRAKHSDDLLFEEIGIGSEGMDRGSGTNGRFDGYAVAKSWSRALYVGYEIKVSRQDFLRDDKWPKYLGACTQFYFVVAHGIADSSEVGEKAGLIECSKNCKKLYVRKKAPRLEPNMDRVFNIMKTAAMRGFKGAEDTEAEAAEKILNDERAVHRGQLVNAALSQKKYQLDTQEKALAKRERLVEEFREALKRRGLRLHHSYDWDTHSRRLEVAEKELDAGLLRISEEARGQLHQLDKLANAATRLVTRINGITALETSTKSTDA